MMPYQSLRERGEREGHIKKMTYVEMSNTIQTRGQIAMKNGKLATKFLISDEISNRTAFVARSLVTKQIATNNGGDARVAKAKSATNFTIHH